MTNDTERGAPLLRTWTPSALSVLRIVAGFLFIVHGTQKLFGVPAPMPGGPAELQSLVGIAGMIEAIGGGLILIGLLTRPTALLLCGEMAAAYFMMHLPKGFWPLINGGELAVLYCFLFLFLVTAGPGPWSVDAFMQTRRLHRPHGPLEPAHVRH